MLEGYDPRFRFLTAERGSELRRARVQVSTLALVSGRGCH